MHDVIDPCAPLYDASSEHDACGVGFVASLHGIASHAILREALYALGHMAHRGAVAADQKTGDGAGVMIEIPRDFFAAEYARIRGRAMEPGQTLSVGAFMMSESGTRDYARARRLVEEVLREYGVGAFAWRPVPVRAERLGSIARATLPEIEQLIAGLPWSGDVAERKLLEIRRVVEKRALDAGVRVYAASWSTRTLIYKGLMIAPIIGEVFPDLTREAFETRFAIVHQRYSTNTLPTWELAQPFRCIAHNGEINTVSGNRAWGAVREAAMGTSAWEDVEALRPIIPTSGSDSASLDAAVELLERGGRPVEEAMKLVMPPAWRADAALTDEARAMYAYGERVCEAWDGPAAVVFTDGRVVGATLDRNGLRPARYKITREGLIVVSSEVGVLNLTEGRVAARGRLGPGQMLVVRLDGQGLEEDAEITARLAGAKPYAEWLGAPREVEALAGEPLPELPESDALGAMQNAFGYSAEELKLVFEPMAVEGHEPVGSMGDDTPLAALSRQPRLVSTYLKQRFAQVTNPPIDSIRERLVMSLEQAVGPRGDWLIDGPEHGHKLTLGSPVLTAQQLDALTAHGGPSVVLDATFEASAAAGASLKVALRRLCCEAEQAARDGARLLILSDKGVTDALAPVPPLLAVGAVHHHLRRRGLRHGVSLIVQSGEPREVHHIASLIGCGARAVHPYLALQTVATVLPADASAEDVVAAQERWREALRVGLLKVMAKMGITSLASYQGAQLFEALGFDDEVMRRCFEGMPARMGGLGFDVLEDEALARHARGFAHERPERLDDWGHLRFRRGGELHGWSPQMLRAIKTFRASNAWEDYLVYRDAAQQRDPVGVRDMLAAHTGLPAIPVEEVEPVEAICARFTSAAMSLGSLSPETHQTITRAMNRLGARSNTGEGGEDPAAYGPDGDAELVAAIKQVASGRFGVTTAYLMHAREIEIKMAQGSKPGEGGQIPGHKVTELIAHLRRSTPGVPLISPPPHHDIYSIEDLAQLIFDLRQVNPAARICVKLVSEAGVGTIAAGVAKAGADTILISGHEGGTGASPLSSIKNAGSSWELGLAEAQQVLVRNDLRERVVLRTDGGLKTGRDLVIAALLGAEEYNFGTAALVALGCRYVRQCHSNTCPVGIATQREDLRARYDGDVDQLVGFLRAVAQDVREELAALGVRSIDALVGRTDWLRTRVIEDHPKASRLDLSALCHTRDASRPSRHNPAWQPTVDRQHQQETLGPRIAEELAEHARTGQPAVRRVTVRNVDRAVGARLSGMVAAHHGPDGLPPRTLTLECDGSAGQSFGAWLVGGVRLILRGEANDYVGKGMSGGELVVRAGAHARLRPEDILAGNTCLYGATGGAAFIAGRAGERFAVRNSGATAVVEGLGDHGCEYMTGGCVLVLGPTGRNFAAGMTGGVAYVYDPPGHLSARLHQGFVRASRVHARADRDALLDLLTRHAEATDSPLATALLANPNALHDFWKISPLATSTPDEAPEASPTDEVAA